MSKLPSLLFALCLGLVATACSDSTEIFWTEAKTDTLIISVELSGSLEAADSLSVGPPSIPNMWQFKITALAPEGEIAKEGDMLVTFDPTSLKELLLSEENQRDATRVELAKKRQEIALARSDEELSIANAEAELRKAKMSADVSGEFTGNLTLQKAQLALAAANENLAFLKAQMKRRMSNNRRSVLSLQAIVKRSQQKVEEINKSIEQLAVVASRTGTVIHTANYRGDKNKVGSEVWKGNNIVEVASLDSMVAEAIVDEADSAMLKVGQMVHLKLEAHPDSDVQGKITEIGRTIQQKSSDIPIKVVPLKLSVESIEGLQMRPGMRFRGEVETERLEKVLVLPRSAVFGSRQGPIAYKKHKSGGNPTLLQLGKTGKRNVQILSGLSASDKVSTQNLAEDQD